MRHERPADLLAWTAMSVRLLEPVGGGDVSTATSTREQLTIATHESEMRDMSATTTMQDEEFFIAEAPTAEILPKYIYVARIEDIFKETFTPKAEFLRPGENTDPFPQYVVTYTLWHTRTKKKDTFRNKLGDKPGRGPNAGLSKFIRALGLGERFRKSEIVGRYVEVTLEDKSFDGSKEQNWISDYMPYTPPADAPVAPSTDDAAWGEIIGITATLKDTHGKEVPMPAAEASAAELRLHLRKLKATLADQEKQATESTQDIPF